MVIAASGGVDHAQVVELASKYFGQLPSSSGEEYVIKGQYVPCQVRIKKKSGYDWER